MSTKATFSAGRFGAPLRFDVHADDGSVWRYEVRSDGTAHPALLKPTMVEDGFGGLVPLGGERRKPNYAKAQLAIEAEMRRLWNSSGARIALTAAGFWAPPPARKSTGGRPHSVDQWILAVRARRALANPYRANEEKILTSARKAGILARSPQPNEFTRLGRARLRQVDRAGNRLLRLLHASAGSVGFETFVPELVGPFRLNAVNAAIEDIVAEQRLRISRYPTAGDRRKRRLIASEVALP